MNREAKQNRLALLIGSILIYLLVFVLFFGKAGENIVAIATLPMLLAGWYYGWQIGLLTIAGIIGTNIVIFMLMGLDGPAIVLNQAPGISVAVVGSIGAGWLRSILNRLRNQTAQLAKERRSLIQEIQAREQAELALREAKELAESANRAKSRFLANVSHELRTPLTVILGYCDLLQMQVTNDNYSTVRGDLSRIQHAGNHLLDLINAILDLSKIEAGKLSVQKETINLRQLLIETRMIVEPLITQNRSQLVIDGIELGQTIYSDSVKLRQILVNVLDNAAKFTHDGVITLRIRTTDGGWSAESANKDPRGATATTILFEVSDTGIGIAADVMMRLFEPFAEAHHGEKQLQGGSGLGLTISQQLCRLLGGDLAISSREGEGTTVTFWITSESEAAELLPTSETAQNSILDHDGTIIAETSETSQQ